MSRTARLLMLGSSTLRLCSKDPPLPAATGVATAAAHGGADGEALVCRVD